MAPRQANETSRKLAAKRQSGKSRCQKLRVNKLSTPVESQPQDIEKKRPQLSSRKSARPQERPVSKDTNTEFNRPLLSPTSNTPHEKACRSPHMYAIKLTQVEFP